MHARKISVALLLLLYGISPYIDRDTRLSSEQTECRTKITTTKWISQHTSAFFYDRPAKNDVENRNIYCWKILFAGLIFRSFFFPGHCVPSCVRLESVKANFCEWQHARRVRFLFSFFYRIICFLGFWTIAEIADWRSCPSSEKRGEWKIFI